ncbi:MAG: [Alphaproteobacteria bacterium]|nr:[FeFe] hydrogenase H-cluster maturation GTPase HydF [Alphaproteobacteria bacterium]
MQSTPKGLRLQIAILGKVNAGKSSFLNLMTGQNVSIVSDMAGTTTDTVEKAQELHLFGPVLWLDTAGFDDQSALAEKRMQKTMEALERADVAIVVSKTDGTADELIERVQKKNIPLIKIINQKGDFAPYQKDDVLVLNACDTSKRDEVVHLVQAALLNICSDDVLAPPAMLGDLVKSGGKVVMIVPIDTEAPKGRLIMPQVQAIRDCLDHNQTVIVTKETDYAKILDDLKTPPDLVVCDSQVVKLMTDLTPPSIKCTTFSILMARMKGDLKAFVEGAKMLNDLADGDKILISESCTHHGAKDDIGTVKIPNLMTKKTGKKLIFEHISGCALPLDLKDYRLIVQCGGCTQNRKAILSKIQAAQKAGVAITNYGVCLSALNGVLERVIEPFDTALNG